MASLLSPGNRAHFVYGIACDHGCIWDLKFCPSGAWELPGTPRKVPPSWLCDGPWTQSQNKGSGCSQSRRNRVWRVVGMAFFSSNLMSYFQKLEPQKFSERLLRQQSSAQIWSHPLGSSPASAGSLGSCLLRWEGAAVQSAPSWRPAGTAAPRWVAQQGEWGCCSHGQNFVGPVHLPWNSSRPSLYSTKPCTATPSILTSHALYWTSLFSSPQVVLLQTITALFHHITFISSLPCPPCSQASSSAATVNWLCKELLKAEAD